MEASQLNASWVLVLAAGLAGVVALFLSPYFRRVKRPPGPRPWPVVGNLPQLGALPHHTLARMAKKYGPLMYLRLGSVPTYIASSPQVAEEILKTHDKVLSSRVRMQVFDIFGYGNKNFGNLPSGNQWRDLRKLFTNKMVAPKRLENTQTLRREEILMMLRTVPVEAKEDGEGSVSIFGTIFQTMTNVITRQMFSERLCGANSSQLFDSHEFHHCLEELTILVGLFNIGDFIPALRKFDLQGYEKQMWALHKRMDAIFQKLIDVREEQRRKGLRDNIEEDFMDVLLTHHNEYTGEAMTHDDVKAMILDSLLAGIDTVANCIEWSMTELMRAPDKYRRLREEVDTLVGRDRLVDESDLLNLPFVKAVIKESLRLHTPGPLLVPHHSSEGCRVGGYYIPPDSRIMVNVYAIARDPEVWDRALEFDPDRFLPDDANANQGDFRYLPFGSGRRGCPGMNLAMFVAGHALAALVQAYDWSLPASIPTPADVDLDEKFGLGVIKANPLKLVPTSRGLPDSFFAGP